MGEKNMVDTESVKQIVEESKQNGDYKFSQKDLLLYISHRIERLEDKHDAQAKHVNKYVGQVAAVASENKGRITTLMWGLSIGMTFLLALIGYVASTG